MLCSMEAFTSPSAILRRAKDHIADEAMWWKGGYSPSGYAGVLAGLPCCAEGAILWAADEAFGDAYAVMRRVLNTRLIPTFNDAPETTHADVLAVFDRAIALADADAVQRIKEAA